MKKRIPLSKPYIGLLEANKAWRAVLSGWLTQNGAEVKHMEGNIAAQINSAVTDFEITTTSNGTTALHLALLSINIGPGDLVAIPDFCYIAVANSVLYCGATPLLVDVQASDSNISVNSIPSNLISQLKAIIVVDNYGIQADLKAIRSYIGDTVPIIYDVSESFPRISQIPEGNSHNLILTGSFYANKVFTSGEGGFIASNSKIIEKIKRIKNQGQNIPGEFSHEILGYNYRLTNIQAAIFNGQWQKRQKILRKRNLVFARYANALKNHNYIRFINQEENPWLVTLQIKNPAINLTTVREKLRKEGIETRPGFQSFHTIPHIAGSAKSVGNLKNSIEFSRTILSLPTYPQMNSRDIEYVIKKLVKSLINVH